MKIENKTMASLTRVLLFFVVCVVGIILFLVVSKILLTY